MEDLLKDPGFDPYERLGISEADVVAAIEHGTDDDDDRTKKIIEKAYRIRAKKAHPDKNLQSEESSSDVNANFLAIIEARDFLFDPHFRQRYSYRLRNQEKVASIEARKKEERRRKEALRHKQEQEHLRRERHAASAAAAARAAAERERLRRQRAAAAFAASERFREHTKAAPTEESDQQRQRCRQASDVSPEEEGDVEAPAVDISAPGRGNAPAAEGSSPGSTRIPRQPAQLPSIRTRRATLQWQKSASRIAPIVIVPSLVAIVVALVVLFPAFWFFTLAIAGVSIYVSCCCLGICTGSTRPCRSSRLNPWG